MVLMESTEQLLSPQEIADLAGVSASTIRREVDRGRLRGFRIGEGRLLRIPESSWREYLERTETNRVTPTGKK